MKKLLISALIICSSFTYAEIPNKPELQDYKTLGSVQWLRSPKPAYTNRELQGKDRDLIIKMYVTENGTIEKTEVVRSSGIEALDLKIQRAVRSARFKPYTENGIRYPFIAEQPFELRSSSDAYGGYNSRFECVYQFKSKNLDAQEKNEKVAFNYQSKPLLRIFEREIENKDRSLDVEFKLSRKNKISDLAVINSSGLKEIDDKVIDAITKTKITAARKFYQFYKLKFTDQIYFNLKDCE